MKAFITALFLLSSTVLLAQVPSPFVPDSNTVGLWHFDETTGSLLRDSSVYHNDAQVIGTSVVMGRFTNARYFNGTSDYAHVPDPLNGSLDFGVNQSFTLEAWFKTTSFAEQRIIRKGLAPIPGYELGLSEGKVFGIIGNREDGTAPDSLLRIISSSTYNDNVWHHAVLVRDRVARKLFLYVDEVSVAAPVVDNFPYSLANNQPLGIGRWYGSNLPLFFQGSIDEIRISNTTRHPGSVLSDTLALWHFDENSGSNVLDSSPYHNNGTASGTTIVPGRFGNARNFNGINAYAEVPNPANGTYDFLNTQSFTVSAWVKTSAAGGIIIRRGLIPVPGFNLSTYQGRAVGVIGNHQGNTWNDTLLTITSAQLINDNVWHEIRMVRDRSQGKLFLYVDGISAATPLTDNFTTPLTNDWSLKFGASLIIPDHFNGAIDEVGIFRGARHPAPVVSDTLALYHFNESSPSIVIDSSIYRNNGIANGTTIIPGPIGNARNFNGSGDYVRIPNPINGVWNFASSQSFTVSVWVKTGGPEGIIVRKGLDNVPGFQISIHFGRAVGRIGNRKGNTWSDTLLTITSSQLINDNAWHELRMVRDRNLGKLFLYIDGVSSAPPLNDNFTIPLANDWPLTFGASLILPDYFTGPIDEVGIFKGARHPASVISDTVALWRYDEPSGSSVIDASPYHNNGFALGTAIVPGQSGFARSFNGVSDYVSVPNPPNLAYNFGPAESFTIETRFKTTIAHSGWLVRRGLVPYAGFGIAISNDRVYGVVGNQEGPPPNDLLIVTSDQPYIDGQWHLATLVRDRTLGKLFLYVDGVRATSPLVDNFLLPLFSSEQLLMGRSHLPTVPQYFSGLLDEVRIFRGARHPSGAGVPIIEVSPSQLNFGNVFVGTIATRNIIVRNVGFFDTLRVTGISSNNSAFTPGISSFSLPPGASQNVQVTYMPSAAGTDTGSVSISSNDSTRSVVRVAVTGLGFAAVAAPLINSIRDIPEDQGKQVRVIWYRSVHDSVGDSLRIGEYNLWRRVGSNNALWDFIASIPAVQFEQYAYVAPTLFDSSRTIGIRWSVFRVSAHTISGSQVFFSAPDSGYSVDNLAPFAPTNLAALFTSDRVNLGWAAPPDPDVQFFGVHRSTTPNFLPSSANQIGTSNTTSYVDQSVGGNPTYYYCVTAIDTAGNQSGPSNQVLVSITDVGNSETLPGQFQLYQNYPNPFNPTAIIRYDVASESRVTIRLFDMLGREVLTFIDENKPTGRYEASINARNLSSGIYFYRMQAGSYSSLKKMVLMK